MLRCCQLQSSPLFTNSLRSIDAGLLRGNDNINQSCRHNGPNQAEITGNVTMSYVSVAVAGRRLLPAPVRWIRRAEERTGDSGHPTVISPSDFPFCLLPSTRHETGVKNLSIFRLFLFFFVSSSSKPLSPGRLSFRYKSSFLSGALPRASSINTFFLGKHSPAHLLYSW